MVKEWWQKVHEAKKMKERFNKRIRDRENSLKNERETRTLDEFMGEKE